MGGRLALLKRQFSGTRPAFRGYSVKLWGSGEDGELGRDWGTLVSSLVVDISVWYYILRFLLLVSYRVVCYPVTGYKHCLSFSLMMTYCFRYDRVRFGLVFPFLLLLLLHHIHFVLDGLPVNFLLTPSAPFL